MKENFSFLTFTSSNSSYFRSLPFLPHSLLLPIIFCSKNNQSQFFCFSLFLLSMAVDRIEEICIDFETILHDEQQKYQYGFETTLINKILVPGPLPNNESFFVVGPYFGNPNLRLHVYYPRLGEHILAYQTEINPPKGKFKHSHWPKIVKDKWPLWVERLLSKKMKPFWPLVFTKPSISPNIK